MTPQEDAKFMRLLEPIAAQLNRPIGEIRTICEEFMKSGVGEYAQDRLEHQGLLADFITARVNDFDLTSAISIATANVRRQ